MGESYLAGSEFKDSGKKEQILWETLQELTGKKLRMIMKNDDITVLVDCTCRIEAVLRRENRIETGHLTLDDVYFDLVNDLGIKIYFPVVQFRSISKFGNWLFYFDSYWWMITVQ